MTLIQKVDMEQILGIKDEKLSKSASLNLIKIKVKN